MKFSELKVGDRLKVQYGYGYSNAYVIAFGDNCILAKLSWGEIVDIRTRDWVYIGPRRRGIWGFLFRY